MLDRIQGSSGITFLLDIWNRTSNALYQSPWFAIRQEVYHVFFCRNLASYWRSFPPSWKHPTLLDYGCGTAEFARTGWIDKGFNTVLADLPGPNRDYLHSKFEGKNIIVTTPDKSLKMGPYDVVICMDVLEHISNPIETLKKLWKVVKPGGHVFMWFETRYPAPGHLLSAIKQKPVYDKWKGSIPIVITEGIGLDWLQKPKRFWQ